MKPKINIHMSTADDIILSGIVEKDITLKYIRELYAIDKEIREINYKDYKTSLTENDFFTDGITPIKNFLEHIKGVTKKYDFIKLSYGYDYFEVQLYNNNTRMETENECAKRLQLEAKKLIKAAHKEKKEYEYYLKLRTKFEKIG